jgi:hypothetical protein
MEKKFLNPYTNELMTREDYAQYLRECAQLWRNWPASSPTIKATGEEQAQRVERMAEQIAKQAL